VIGPRNRFTTNRQAVCGNVPMPDIRTAVSRSELILHPARDSGHRLFNTMSPSYDLISIQIFTTGHGTASRQGTHQRHRRHRRSA
jgi:hypothetical protein